MDDESPWSPSPIHPGFKDFKKPWFSKAALNSNEYEKSDYSSQHEDSPQRKGDASHCSCDDSADDLISSRNLKKNMRRSIFKTSKLKLHMKVQQQERLR